MNSGALANQVLDRCDSTNDLARQLGQSGAPHGTWVSARIQERGRGRLGRSWQSVEGNLFLSMVVRIENKSLWSWVPLTATVAVAGFFVKQYPSLAVGIKWPNDLWVQGAKLGGVLCEAIGTQQDAFIVIGLGLNCLFAPQGLDQATTSISDQLSPRRVSADDVRLEIIEGLKTVLADLVAHGSGVVSDEYERLAIFASGTEVEWDGHRGRVIGLGKMGELRVEVQGREVSLFAEDVKLRFPKASDEFPV
ncbi:biotin--[acetyl-CoA-carboxylase] ligase [Bdellovibrionota bacterium FG-1]